MTLRHAARRMPAARRAAGVGRAARHRAWIAGRDLRTRLTGGRRAPLYAERAMLDPAHCSEAILDVDRLLDRRRSGEIHGGDWDVARVPIGHLVKVDACHRHFEDGVAWEDTGIYEHVMAIVAERPGADGCHTIDDVVARYARLDEVFAQVSADGRLRSARELYPGVREEGGVYVHFDRAGAPVFGRGGTHRLAIARIVGLASIPVQVGVVHRAGLDRWRDSLVSA